MESSYICLLTTKRGRRIKSYEWRTEKERDREREREREKLRKREREKLRKRDVKIQGTMQWFNGFKM